MTNAQLIKRAALNSLGVLVYVYLVSLVMTNGDKIFGAADHKPFAPIAFLLLFVLSALITGGLVLGKPILLFLDGLKKEGVKLLIYTGASLLVLVLIMFAILIYLK